jgi:hypothetical protein
MKGKSRTASAFPFSLHGIMNNAAAARSESPRMAAAGRELLTRTLAAVSGNGGLYRSEFRRRSRAMTTHAAGVFTARYLMLDLVIFTVMN